MLETMKEVDSRVANLPKSRFLKSRKFQLAPSPDQPLILQEYVSKALAGEAYRGLRTRLMRLHARQGLKSIVVSSTLPGEGKTLTTMNLALSFASLSGMSVLIVDADLRTCGLTELIGRPPGPGLAEVLEGTVKFEEAIVTTDVPNLYVVPAGTLKCSASECFASPHWKEFMAWSSEACKIIVVDAPSVLPLADFELIASGCDGVLVVVRAKYTHRDALRKVSAQIDPNKLLGVVLNGTEIRVQSIHDRYFNEDQRRNQK
jgi:capsular exopolysaccharide synthesis family protein